MELIPLIEMLDTIHIARAPLRVMADGVIGGRQLMREGSVGFQVILIHNIDAELIRQLKKKRIGRIVRCADSIDIKRLAEQHVFLNLVRCHGVAVGGAGIVMVNTVQLHPVPVNQEDIPLNFDSSEADLLRNAAGWRLITDGVENRGFCIPFRHVKALKNSLCFSLLCRNRL